MRTGVDSFANRAATNLLVSAVVLQCIPIDEDLYVLFIDDADALYISVLHHLHEFRRPQAFEIRRQVPHHIQANEQHEKHTVDPVEIEFLSRRLPVASVRIFLGRLVAFAELFLQSVQLLLLLFLVAHEWLVMRFGQVHRPKGFRCRKICGPLF